MKELNEEWDKLRKPLEELGFHVIGVSPDISLCDEKTRSGSFEMPVYAVKRFLDKLETFKEYARLYSFLRENPEWCGLDYHYRLTVLDKIIKRSIRYWADEIIDEEFDRA